jgi:hypothetical protein
MPTNFLTDKLHSGKRKKAFHRAVKRGELWALQEKKMHDIMNAMAREFYKGMLEESPFMKLVHPTK